MKPSTRNPVWHTRFLWLAVAAFIVSAISSVMYIQAENDVRHAHERRHQSYRIASKMQQSSDDMTRMVRTYVATGEARYKRHHQEILDIRNGLKPRPVDYHIVYWDLVLGDDRRPRPMGETRPLLDLMRDAHFADDEFAKLAEAKAASDALTQTEFAAMKLIEANDPPRPADRAQAIALLHDAAYHDAKARIMRPIGEFLLLVERRTAAIISAAEATANRLRLLFATFGVLLALLVWQSQRSLRAIRGGSLRELYDGIVRIGRGDFTTPLPGEPGPPDSVLGWLAITRANLARIDAERRIAEARTKRLNQIYAALSQCNQAIARCTRQAELFEQICGIAVNFGGMKMAWIGMLDESGQRIVPVASYGAGNEVIGGQSISIAPDGPNGQGPTAEGFRENRPCWVQDYTHDPNTRNWHALGERYGWGAFATLQLHLNHTPVGVFNLYANDPDVFDDDMRKQLLEMAGDIDFALAGFQRETLRREAEDRAHYLAHFDALTGLPNRAQLEDLGRYALNLAQRNHGPLALLLLDVDQFKDINDTLGHRAGDALLIELAGRLREALREGDTVARLGGDEFIFLLHGLDANGAAHVAEKLLTVLARPCHLEAGDLTVSGSIGIALFPSDANDMDGLIKCADAAMYRAKQGGRRGYRFYTAEMQLQSARHLQLGNALRDALEQDQLSLHFQPQIAIADGRIVGAEALLRWTHPELGAVSPVEFIPAAEDSGLILPIGEWVLRQAVRQARLWRADSVGPLVMAVNLSAVQFRHPDLPRLVTRILDEEGYPPEGLELELTESVAMHDPGIAIGIMNDLHRRGVRMSIDDFGTGFSSLSYLKKFRASKLKIDRSFVRDIHADPEDRAIVRAIIHMAQGLGLKTIAEGVETAEQLAFLRENGCDEVQGYYYCKPAPDAGFREFVNTRRASVTPAAASDATPSTEHQGREEDHHGR